jgi:hypothetical protein
MLRMKQSLLLQIYGAFLCDVAMDWPARQVVQPHTSLASLILPPPVDPCVHPSHGRVLGYPPQPHIAYGNDSTPSSCRK